MIELIVEGRGLEPMLREMDRSLDIRVIGPHISREYPGAGVDGERIAVAVRADNAVEACDLVRSYLPPDGNYTIRPVLAWVERPTSSWRSYPARPAHHSAFDVSRGRYG